MRPMLRRVRVATLEECARYGGTLSRGLLPPIAGGAGWSTPQQSQSTVTNTVDIGGGVPGVSLAFGSNVTAGQVICCVASYGNSGPTAATWDDAATTPNVTSWHTGFLLGSSNSGGTNFPICLAWGVATATGGCTPRVGFAAGGFTGTGTEIYIASFNAPAGTPAVDGTFHSATGSGSVSNQATGAGSNDLVFGYSLIGSAPGSYGGTAAAMATAQNGNLCFYDANVAGNDTITNTATGFDSLVAAISITGGATSLPELVMAPPTPPRR